MSATFAVANLNDSGAGSLRACLADASAGDTLDLGTLTGTISLSSELLITKDVTIVGPGMAQLMLSGGGASRAIHINSGLNVSISGLRIDDGAATLPPSFFTPDYGYGGGIWVDGDIDAPRNTLSLNNVYISGCTSVENGGGLDTEFCDVTLAGCRFSGNTAVAAISAMGGGVYISQDSTLTAVGCTFDANQSHATGSTADAYGNGSETTALGGGVALLGAGASSFTNCTFANNQVTADVGLTAGSVAAAFGGGLSIGVDGNFTLTNCTIANNAANGTSADTFGGGAAVFSFGTSNPDGSDVLKVVNTVIAGNTSATMGADAFGFDVSTSAVTNYKNNVLGIADDSGITMGVNANRGGSIASPMDAKLGALADNGGPAPTMMPQGGSPVLGIAAASETPRRDGRGYPRSPFYDVGAVERQSNYSPGLDQVPVAFAATDVPYLSPVKATDVDGDPITFTLTQGPAWLTVTDNGNGTAMLSGLPTADDAGAFPVTLRASDGTLNWDESFTLNVAITPTLLTTDGLLKVVGTNDADIIHVWQPRGAGQTIRVAIGSQTYNFDDNLVTAIQVFALGGNDQILGNCADLGIYVNAGDGNDLVGGGELNDTLTGGGGDDTLYGMAGNDWIDGNSGRDNINGGSGDDRMYGGNGGDTLDGGAGRDVMYGEVGSNLYLTRDNTRDWIFATDARTNFVQGDSTRDLLYGASVLPEVSAIPPRRR